MKRNDAICESFGCEYRVWRCEYPDGRGADRHTCGMKCREINGCDGIECKAENDVPLDCPYVAEMGVVQ